MHRGWMQQSVRGLRQVMSSNACGCVVFKGMLHRPVDPDEVLYYEMNNVIRNIFGGQYFK